MAWAVGSFGMSAVFFQDTFGLITFDRDFTDMAAVRARLGKNQVIHCLDAYQHGRGLEPMHRAGHVGHSIGSALRRTSLVPVVSDFLFEDVETVLRDLAHLNAVHDVFIVIVDGSAAFALPPASAGWIQVHDVESGRRQLLSRAAVKRLAARTRPGRTRSREPPRSMTSTSCGSVPTRTSPPWRWRSSPRNGVYEKSNG